MILRAASLRYAAAILLAVAAMAFAGVTTAIAFRDITVNQDRTRAAVDAAFAERAAFEALVDEETGVRGYVATGDPRFLEPYTNGRTAYARYRAALPAFGGAIAATTTAVLHAGDGLQPYFSAQITAVQRGRRNAATASLPAGKAAFDDLRSADRRAVATIQAAIASSRNATRHAIELARSAIVATAFVLMLATALAVRLALSARTSSNEARRDAVTSLPNRRAFEERLDQVLAGRRSDQRCAVLYIDLDRFKPVNDRLGHAAGDALLSLCGERLRRAVRPGDLVARLGGDEFGILLCTVNALADVNAIGARVLAEIAAPFTVHGTTVQIGASIGTAVVPDDGEAASDVIRIADEAMYRAKRTTRA